MRRRIPVGAIVLSKVRDTRHDGKRVILTEYILTENSGLRAINGKEEASEILRQQIINYVRRESVLPSNATISRTYSNGDFDLKFTASDYDAFYIFLSQKIVGSNQLTLSS